MAAVIETSPTPNPDAMKFTLDVTLDGMLNVTDPSDADGSPFAATLFATPGVASVFGTADFVTITREPEADWEPIKAAVAAAAAEHL
jgi:hypothetical protein